MILGTKRYDQIYLDREVLSDETKICSILLDSFQAKDYMKLQYDYFQDIYYNCVNGFIRF